MPLLKDGLAYPRVASLVVPLPYQASLVRRSYPTRSFPISFVKEINVTALFIDL